MKNIFYESWLAKTFLWDGYTSITLGCFIFTKQKEPKSSSDTGRGYFSPVSKTHELTHVEQWKELGIIGLITSLILFFVTWNWFVFLIPILMFYIVYLIEYLIKFIIKFIPNIGKLLSGKTSIWKINNDVYHNISLEIEAYNNQKNLNYPKERKHFDWIKYMFRK